MRLLLCAAILSLAAANKLSQPNTLLTAGAPHVTEHWVGGEYTPSGASNELWLAFYPRYRAQVESDLRSFRARLGVTALRLFLHSLLYENTTDLLTTLDDFLGLASANGMQVGLVFFDSDWAASGASTAAECEPTPGVHNSCWMQSPQAAQRTSVDRYEPYVTGVVARFAADARVAWFEIYNEPNMSDPFVAALRAAAYGWAKALAPLAPVLSCWDFDAAGVSDLADIHKYDTAFLQWRAAAYGNASAGALFTEAGCRNFQAPHAGDAGSPLAVLRFLETLRLRRDAGLEPYVPGALLAWELAVGNSNTRWHWGSLPGTPEPAIPWCGWLWPGGTPVSYTEAAALRRYTTGVDDFIFLDHFAGPVTAVIGEGNPALTLLPGGAYWAQGVRVGAGVLVEAAVMQDPSLGGVWEVVLQAVNASAPPQGSSAAPPPCNTSTLLPNTNLCPGMPGERNFILPPSEPNPAAACASACCALPGVCTAWVLLPGTAFEDKNCSCSAAAPCTCCWLKPQGCRGSSPYPHCTAGLLPPPPPPPRPLTLGYSVRVDYGALPPTLSLARQDRAQRVQLGAFPLNSIPNGVVQGFNMLRIALLGNGSIAVYFNPFFQEFGFVGNASDAGRTPHAPPPRILATDPQPLPPGGLAVLAGGVTVVDYVSVLPVGLL